MNTTLSGRLVKEGFGRPDDCTVPERLVHSEFCIRGVRDGKEVVLCSENREGKLKPETLTNKSSYTVFTGSRSKSWVWNSLTIESEGRVTILVRTLVYGGHSFEFGGVPPLDSLSL